jgi:glutamine amidotransferase
MIALVDSEIGNLASVIAAFGRVDASVQVVRDAAALARASAIVLPGVGAFGDGMAGLRSRGFVDPLREAARAGKPILGICLGMQLLVEESEEHGRHEGLGVLPGRVRRLAADRPGYRVPNIGWCDVTVVRTGALFPDSGRGDAFYFVHSYFVDTAAENVTATIEFSGASVPAALEAENICAVQFHPEKSQDAGLDLLARWLARLRAEA